MWLFRRQLSLRIMLVSLYEITHTIMDLQRSKVVDTHRVLIQNSLLHFFSAIRIKPALNHGMNICFVFCFNIWFRIFFLAYSRRAFVIHDHDLGYTTNESSVLVSSYIGCSTLRWDYYPAHLNSSTTSYKQGITGKYCFVICDYTHTICRMSWRMQYY